MNLCKTVTLLILLSYVPISMGADYKITIKNFRNSDGVETTSNTFKLTRSYVPERDRDRYRINDLIEVIEGPNDLLRIPARTIGNEQSHIYIQSTAEPANNGEQVDFFINFFIRRSFIIQQVVSDVQTIDLSRPVQINSGQRYHIAGAPFGIIPPVFVTRVEGDFLYLIPVYSAIDNRSLVYNSYEENIRIPILPHQEGNLIQMNRSSASHAYLIAEFVYRDSRVDHWSELIQEIDIDESDIDIISPEECAMLCPSAQEAAQ